jgi:type IV pilus assembly protein PilX
MNIKLLALIKTNKQLPAKQKGVVLIMSLVFLIGLSIIGIAAMDTAALELKMSGSTQRHITAMSQAESTLLTAEQAIDAIIANPASFAFTTVGDGYYAKNEVVNMNSIDWSGISSEQGVDVNNRYVIQYLGSKAIPGDGENISQDDKVAGGHVYTFSITARSEGAKNTVRLVQSLYVTQTAP